MPIKPNSVENIADSIKLETKSADKLILWFNKIDSAIFGEPLRPESESGANARKNVAVKSAKNMFNLLNAGKLNIRQ